MTIFLAIYKTDGLTVQMEFKPILSADLLPLFGGIDIESVHVQREPITWAEQRALYQMTPLPVKAKQLAMFNAENL